MDREFLVVTSNAGYTFWLPVDSIQYVAQPLGNSNQIVLALPWREPVVILRKDWDQRQIKTLAPNPNP